MDSQFLYMLMWKLFNNNTITYSKQALETKFFYSTATIQPTMMLYALQIQKKKKKKMFIFVKRFNFEVSSAYADEQ